MSQLKSKDTKEEVMLDTRSREYVEWMASVWKANDERNKRLAKEAGE